MAVDGTFYHDLGPVRRALAAAGTCWRAVGEVIAWRTAWADSATWAGMWWASPAHRAVLDDWGFDRSGGYYTGRTSRSVAVFYVLDGCR